MLTYEYLNVILFPTFYARIPRRTQTNLCVQSFVCRNLVDSTVAVLGVYLLFFIYSSVILLKSSFICNWICISSSRLVILSVMDWRLLTLFLLLILKSAAGEKLLNKRNAQGSKCPYSLIDIASLIHSESKQQSTFWSQLKDGISEFIWGKEGSSLDHVSILSPDAVKSVGDCHPVQSSNIVCNSSYPYRSHDGTCNNLDHPSWGMSEECQLRFLPASYEGADGFRVSSSGGGPLPEPRDLSLGVFKNADRPTPALSALFVFFGQFVAHDIMLTPTATRNTVSCCPYDQKNRARVECLPIFVRPDDPYYSRFNTTCLNFERTVTCSKCDPTTGKVEKFNKETAALDLSMVYGTNEELAKRLRDETGKLRSEKDDQQKELLPRNEDGFSNFCSPFQPEECFLAGDDRDDMHATLTSFHTLFLREHNRVVGKLKEINPHWKAETLYQEARKIFVGQWQNMVYGEYLPLALGPRHMDHFGLRVGGLSRYNSSARLGMWLEVSTAGFRLHNMVPSETGLRELRFYETQMNPGLVREGCAEDLLRGASRVPSQKFDQCLVEDVNGQFLRIPGRPDGLDTASIDIQRGRDNGLPPYVEMAHFLTGRRMTTYDSLNDLMSPKNIRLLKENYKSVEDVDLWLGMQLEKHPPGSVLGFNTATLTSLQFYFLKYADRFYFEHRGEDASFTDAQLESLRKSTLSRLMCDNMNLTFIQKRALLLPSHENQIVNCNEIEKVDLNLWKSEL